MSIPAWCYEIVRVVSEELDGPGGSTEACAAVAYSIFRRASWCVGCDGTGVDVDSLSGLCGSCDGAGRVLPDSCVTYKDIAKANGMLERLHNWKGDE